MGTFSIFWTSNDGEMTAVRLEYPVSIISTDYLGTLEPYDVWPYKVFNFDGSVESTYSNEENSTCKGGTRDELPSLRCNTILQSNP